MGKIRLRPLRRHGRSLGLADRRIRGQQLDGVRVGEVVCVLADRGGGGDCEDIVVDTGSLRVVG